MANDEHSINDKPTKEGKQYQVNSNNHDEWHVDKLL